MGIEKEMETEKAAAYESGRKAGMQQAAGLCRERAEEHTEMLDFDMAHAANDCAGLIEIKMGGETGQEETSHEAV
ncbi:hypothetical protein SAMN02949497_4493 [Methylomagnum ishizawai]|uniref:Uncharacterized protein n=1 Tax=Methylomagnum ishizawai TaxID=1760988 RepID=A0A1Y6DBT7_9GAMM|nr:hypothetical protein [Methylomagnum ishizawai]SMF97075.1 hypothetical protein SAMN02949497_4493 [Methylomagnum ishizawai]